MIPAQAGGETFLFGTLAMTFDWQTSDSGDALHLLEDVETDSYVILTDEELAAIKHLTEGR